MAEQQLVGIEVFGHRFALRSEKSADDVQQIAAYVDRQLQRAAEHAKTAGLLRVAIRAALTSADEYHSAIGCLDLPHAG